MLFQKVNHNCFAAFKKTLLDKKSVYNWQISCIAYNVNEFMKFWWSKEKNKLLKVDKIDVVYKRTYAYVTLYNDDVLVHEEFKIARRIVSEVEYIRPSTHLLIYHTVADFCKDMEYNYNRDLTLVANYKKQYLSKKKRAEEMKQCYEEFVKEFPDEFI